MNVSPSKQIWAKDARQVSAVIARYQGPGHHSLSQAVTNPALKMKHKRLWDEFDTEKIPGGQRAAVQDTWLQKAEHEIHGAESEAPESQKQ